MEGSSSATKGSKEGRERPRQEGVPGYNAEER